VLADLLARRSVIAEQTPGVVAPSGTLSGRGSWIPSVRAGTLEVMATTEDAALDLRVALASAHAALARADEAAKGLADGGGEFAADIDQVKTEVARVLKRAGGPPPRGARR